MNLEEVKNHLRVENTADDDYITKLISASSAWLAQFLGDDLPEAGTTKAGIVEAAQLLLIGDLYENRQKSLTTALQTNPTFMMLIEPLRTKAVL